MAKLYNLARMTTATAGTGTITLGTAVAGYLTFALAGVSNGDVVDYAIKDGSNSEHGTGTYTSAGTTLTRTVTKSTNGNAAINLSGTAEVFISPRAETLNDASVITTGDVAAARMAANVLSAVGYTPMNVGGGQNIFNGFTITPSNLGNITSFTVAPLSGNYQYGTNHGAATWTAPASDCAVDILVTNDASAGAITFSGFTNSANTGDALTTTNGHKFLIAIRKIGGTGIYLIKALQ